MKKCFLLIILLTSTHLSYAQYINAVMINSCGTEGNTELFLIKNGPLALTVAPANIDLRYGTTSPASTTYTDNISATGNTAVVTALNALLTGGCDFTFINAPLGSVIPAGARIMVLDFDILPAQVSNYSNWCGAGAGNIYVIFSTDTSWGASGNFANTPASSRFFQSIISGTTINYSYDENWTPNADGDIAFWRVTGGAAAQYQNYPSCSPPAIPLPVVLTHFEGQSEKSGVNVFWKTSTEINNVNFEVQKSRNARSFETIAKVNGNGNSQDISAYSFIDEKPFEGSNYYRLRQNDFDGSTNFTRIIQVYWESNMPFVNLYPNPINTDEVLNIEKSEALILQSVTNDYGQFSSIEKLKQGSYILQFADEKANTVTKRLIVK